MEDKSNNKVEAVDVLNHLLERNYDAEKGYKKAAEDIDNSLLKDFFRDYSGQRYTFGHEIKEEIRRMNGEPEKGSSVKGDLHRTWIDVKSLLTGKDNEAVVKECIRGETTALEDYEDALRRTDLPPTTREVVQRQHDQIQGAVNRLNQIQNTLK
ncbi:ferritin-like domain-containing protein [Nafulsella turpanensis]|uniref:ferritin-like domain-containing protein n=1 Tax=Nafulsella turpanensis TaxID=1265690 RepID=UPI0003453F7C|nr:PA2169 family four-helix-bundle protein [Nafulsella turpanensis]